MILLAALLACTTESPPAAEAPAMVPPTAEAPAPPSPTAQAPAAPDAATGMGTIGGEPILPRPVVLGGIDTSAVEAGIAAQMDAIQGCHSARAPDRAGKVLVKFSILEDGTVADPSIKSTSLRLPEVEACVSAKVAEARFPQLERGDKALVSYPFQFPQG